MMEENERNADNAQRFIGLFRSKIHREGAEDLLEYLMSDDCDFFTAPASTRYHGSYPGGLLEHSLNVYDCLKDYLARPKVKEEYGLSYSEESIAIVSLMHDLCKTNFYKESVKNVKENGSWKEKYYYTIEDELPYGHGEKSVYLLSQFLRLSHEEAFAIRYHMGFSGNEDNNTVGAAFAKFPLAIALATADMEATYFMEVKGEW